MQSFKDKPLKASDYVKRTLIFVMHTLILIGLGVLAIFLNATGDVTFKQCFTDKERLKNFTNLISGIILLVVILFVYFSKEYKDFIAKQKNVHMIFLIIEVTLIIDFCIARYLRYSFAVFARPFAFGALLTLYLVDRRSAVFVNTINAVLVFLFDAFTSSGLASPVVYCALVLHVICGVVSVYLLNGVTGRVKIFLAGFILSLPTFALAMGINYLPRWEDNLKLALYCLDSGIFSVVFTTVLLPVYESVFNIVTDFRLSEITNANAKIIAELRNNAPGTYNHSLTVATLAEACAVAIGENVLRARAAAYYHDVGKLRQPDYYTENQQGYNPHDELTPELSTDIIRSHTIGGAEFIKENNLPDFLADVAREHHGTLPIKYFYAKAKKLTENEVDVKEYSYFGPKPGTKIACIIMICDAAEAKVRTMADRSFEKVYKAVSEIIEERMDLEQFNDCDITLKELDGIRLAIVTCLAGVYHSRLKYPKLKIKKSGIENDD